MTIYTKFGDTGNTSLFGGVVVKKDDPRVGAYGDIDELNAMVGVILAFNDRDLTLAPLYESLQKIQNDLFIIGAELSAKNTKVRSISPMRSSEFEKEIDQMWSELPPLTNFILPGGTKTSSLLHLARTVCRRAERSIVSLSNKEKINPDIIVYVNRLSDLLFAMARYANYKKKVGEIIWKGK